MSVYSKIITLKNAFFGYADKYSIDRHGHQSLPKLQYNPNKKGNVIVSLTSYGRRISDSIVYYTLVSILKQTRLPDRLILWIDNDKWNQNNIPQNLKVLQEQHGVEIMYSKENIRSYTKLIPTLRLYPEDIIITIDDDIIYHKQLISTLLERYESHKDCIISFNCVRPSFNSNGEFKSYQQWKPCQDGDTELTIFSKGFEAVLYPPHSLHEDVFDQATYQSLCPMADDIWFWLQAIRKGTIHHCIVNKEICNHSFDAIYQFFHNNSALMQVNISNHANDTQLDNCIKHYNMSKKIFDERL